MKLRSATAHLLLCDPVPHRGPGVGDPCYRGSTGTRCARELQPDKGALFSSAWTSTR